MEESPQTIFVFRFPVPNCLESTQTSSFTTISVSPVLNRVVGLYIISYIYILYLLHPAYLRIASSYAWKKPLRRPRMVINYNNYIAGSFITKNHTVSNIIQHIIPLAFRVFHTVSPRFRFLVRGSRHVKVHFALIDIPTKTHGHTAHALANGGA